MKKKGQLGNLQGIIATIIIVGILVSAGFLIMEEFLGEDSLIDNSFTISNETGAYINDTTYTVTEADAGGFNSFAVTTAWNNTDGTEILSGNYTVDADAGTIVGTTAGFNYSAVDLAYTYNSGSEAWVGVNDTIEAMTTIPELLGLIILIAVIGIILAVIFNVIPGTRVSGA